MVLNRPVGARPRPHLLVLSYGFLNPGVFSGHFPGVVHADPSGTSPFETALFCDVPDHPADCAENEPDDPPNKSSYATGKSLLHNVVAFFVRDDIRIVAFPFP
ncbi:hypothetical protein HDK90DRAFT_497719 [Phyllosticta capitalensis]|uniref:Uncharacterized protein n=1 Tax=Phyllosticta capitalensis TaxID=121624 RepID=A0ABR1YCD9_9PEZI